MRPICEAICSDITIATPPVESPAEVKALRAVPKSQRSAAASVPVAGVAVTPLAMPAGLLAVAATLSDRNCWSMNSAIAAFLRSVCDRRLRGRAREPRQFLGDHDNARHLRVAEVDLREGELADRLRRRLTHPVTVEPAVCTGICDVEGHPAEIQPPEHRLCRAAARRTPRPGSAAPPAGRPRSHRPRCPDRPSCSKRRSTSGVESFQRFEMPQRVGDAAAALCQRHRIAHEGRALRYDRTARHISTAPARTVIACSLPLPATAMAFGIDCRSSVAQHLQIALHGSPSRRRASSAPRAPARRSCDLPRPPWRKSPLSVPCSRACFASSPRI